MKEISIPFSTELPGFNKEEVDIQLNVDIIVLNQKKRKEEESENYIYREISCFCYEMAVNLLEEVDPYPSKVEGIMDNDVPNLKIPKREQEAQ